eukprot:6712143-Pyramimonas_sp.AAC.1
MNRGRHANPASGAFGGAPHGATTLVRGGPKWLEAATRTLPLGLSVELPLGSRNAVLGLPNQRCAEDTKKGDEEE